MDTSITMNPDADPKALIEVVQLAENLGFSDCYVADQGSCRDVYVTMTMMAGATKRIHFGPGVTNPYCRHPVATAIAIASLDEYSGGRAFLGLGAGGFRMLGPLNLKQTTPLRACREAAEISRQLWSGGSVNYQGTLFQLEGARLTFPSRADIELHWAARGPKMLALGGKLAEVVLLSGIPRFELGNTVAHVRKGAQEANRQVRIRYSFPLVYDDESRARARERTSYRLVASEPHVQAQVGVTPELAKEMSRLIIAQGPQAAAPLVTDEMLRDFILEGDVDSCASTLRSLVKTHSLGGITIEILDPANTRDLLLRAAEIIARL